MKVTSILLLVTGTLFTAYFNEAENNPGHGTTFIHASASSNNLDSPPAPHLFPVEINRKFGFIDSLGNLALPAIYEATREFSEGLCAVRVKGLYGFIDTRGKMIVEPRFDFATEYHEGLVLVFLKSKPCFINKKGKLIVPPHYAELYHFKDGRAFVQTISKKCGVINRSGVLVVDTAFQFIRNFNNGFAVAAAIGHRGRDSDEMKKDPQITIIDSTGHMLVSFRVFNGINGYNEGYCIASIPGKNKDEYSQDVILNRKAEIIYRCKEKESISSRKVSNGIFRIVRRRDPDDFNSDIQESYVKITGETLFENDRVRYGNDFSENLAFWLDQSNDRNLINGKGKIIGVYDGLMGEGFKNGMALVYVKGKYGVIDTTASFILPPTFEKINYNGITGGYLFFGERIPGHNEDDEYKYGVADIHGNILIPPTFHSLISDGFEHGLLKTSIDGRVAFFNKRGTLVWKQEQADPYKTFALNTDYMRRGYFDVNPESADHLTNGGIESQRNGLSYKFPPAKLSVTVMSNEEATVKGRLKAITAYVANTTGDTIMFNTQDDRLYMKMQALNSEGQWQDIEDLPDSDVGNSYYSIPLVNDSYWEFSALVYDGSIRTKLRLQLIYVDPSDTVDLPPPNSRHTPEWRFLHRRQLKVYSNEFDGTINPGQLWRRRNDVPLGVFLENMEY